MELNESLDISITEELTLKELSIWVEYYASNYCESGDEIKKQKTNQQTNKQKTQPNPYS